jgi:hypothetical protein
MQPRSRASRTLRARSWSRVWTAPLGHSLGHTGPYEAVSGRTRSTDQHAHLRLFAGSCRSERATNAMLHTREAGASKPPAPIKSSGLAGISAKPGISSSQRLTRESSLGSKPARPIVVHGMASGAGTDMERGIDRVAVRLHGCSSDAGVDSASADARISCRAIASLARTEMPACPAEQERRSDPGIGLLGPLRRKQPLLSCAVSRAGRPARGDARPGCGGHMRYTAG